MIVSHMKQVTSEAKERDLSPPEWIAQLAIQSKQLHRTIKIPETQGDQTLFNFVIQYIEVIPNFIEYILSTLTEQKLLKSLEPVIKQTMFFFRNPPKQVRTKHSFDRLGELYQLMDQAYLAHRLLEELNDAFMLQVGTPLLPMDTTKANLIVHRLVGDAHGCELEDLVQKATTRFKLYQIDFQTSSQKQHIPLSEQSWPCFSTELGVNLQFRECHLRLV